MEGGGELSRELIPLTACEGFSCSFLPSGNLFNNVKFIGILERLVASFSSSYSFSKIRFPLYNGKIKIILDVWYLDSIKGPVLRM